MSSHTGIHAWGSYLPRFRMRRQVIADQVAWLDKSLGAAAKGRRTVANWDEDAITMAVAAGRRALAGLPRGQCAGLVFASTTAPFLDRSNVGLMCAALALPETTLCREAGGSQRAATTAMLGVLDSKKPPLTLIAASDRRSVPPGSSSELHYGDGAAAVALGKGKGVARYLGGTTINRDFVHQYRSQERDHDYTFEDRWVRDEGVMKTVPAAIREAAGQCGVDVTKLDHLVLALPRRHAVKVCDNLGVPAAALCDDLSATVGQTGVGHGLLQLVHTLDQARAGQTICVAGFGQGCDVALFETTARLETSRAALSVADAMEQGVELHEYLKLPVFGRRIALERGIRAESDKRTVMAAHWRRHKEINAMVGSQCDECGTPHFPSARVCVDCRAIDRMSDYAFAHRAATLKTFTEDWLGATPAPPLCYGNVAFEGGGNAFLELTDVEAGSLRIGMPLSMHFRVKDYDDRRGFRRYFWKPAPLTGAGDG